MRWRAALAIAMVVACKESPKTTAGAPDAASSAPAASAAPILSGSASASASAAASATPIGSASTNTRLETDGGTRCALLTGPVAMPFKRNGALAVSGDGVDAVFNDGGKPRVVHVAASTKAKSDQGGVDVTVPPCAITATHYYCPDADGGVHRVPHGGGADAVIGHAKKGTRIDAATLAGDHSVVAYVERKHTEEGWLTTASVALDDRPPERLDETGATSVALAPRGDGVLAIMVDARAALTVVHARSIAFARGGLAKGEDIAAFVGNPPDNDAPQPAIAVLGDRRAFALVPLPEDTLKFGMAAVKIDDPPKLDEPAKWSAYPSGKGKLAIDATRGGERMLVGRVRADAEGKDAAVVLELGQLDADSGAFTSFGPSPVDGDARDVAVESDAAGDLWLLVTDRTGSFVERRHCP